ncbi:MAG: thermonuclease family protein [Pseudomonadota bacterium]
MRIIFLYALLVPLVSLVFAFVHTSMAQARDSRIEARVIRVIDGDTIQVEAQPWPGMRIDARIRLPDIQAPETFRPSCEAERLKGEAATEWLRDRLEGQTVWLSNIRTGKFGGRFIAHVHDQAGDVASALITAGIAAPWDGRTANKPSFCQVSNRDNTN